VISNRTMGQQSSSAYLDPVYASYLRRGMARPPLPPAVAGNGGCTPVPLPDVVEHGPCCYEDQGPIDPRSTYRGPSSGGSNGGGWGEPTLCGNQGFPGYYDNKTAYYNQPTMGASYMGYMQPTMGSNYMGYMQSPATSNYMMYGTVGQPVTGANGGYYSYPYASSFAPSAGYGDAV
jgi:hypothetical protein